MATLVLAGATGRTIYPALLGTVIEGGYTRCARDLPTLDLGPTVIELDSPYNALPIGVGRSLSRRVAAAEAVQLIGAFSDPELLFAASPNFKRYAEDDGHFHGAYGVRIGRQVWSAYRKLTEDPDTRQAVVTLWDSDRDNEKGKRDYPCTLSLVFSRGPKRFLELDVTMRSNDVWRGFPYDIFQFTQLQLTMARALGWEPGTYRHHVMSLHLYLDDINDAKRVHTRFVAGYPPEFVEELPTGFGIGPQDISESMQVASKVAYDHHYRTTAALSDSEAWYWHVLRGQKPELRYVEA